MTGPRHGLAAGHRVSRLRAGSVCTGHRRASGGAMASRLAGGPAAGQAGCRDNARTPCPRDRGPPGIGRRPRRAAGGDAERHPDRGRVRVIQPDQAQGSQVSAAFLQLGDHAHRERDGRADLLGPVVRALPVPAPGQEQPASHNRPHLRADLRLPRGSGIRGHPDKHVAAMGVQLVPVQVLAVNPPPGWLSSDVTSSQSPSGGGASPARDRTSRSSRSRSVRDARHPAVRAGRPAGRRRLRARPACSGIRGTDIHGHSPPGSLMDWPRGCARHARSALHSARDVKSRGAPAAHRAATSRLACRSAAGAAVRRQSPGTGGRHDRGAVAGRPPPAGRASQDNGRRGADRGDLHPGRAAANPGRGPGCPGPAAARPGEGAGQGPCRERADLKSAARVRVPPWTRHAACRRVPAGAPARPRPASKCTGRKVMTGKDSGGRPRQAGRLADDSTTRAASGPGTADRNSSLLAVPVAFYGRTAHAAGTGDSRADRHRQLALCRAVAAACGARVTTEFFERTAAPTPLAVRPQGRSLLAALSGPGRVAATVVVADPWCLLPRRPAPEGTGILARLAFQRVQLVLADSGLVIASAEEYALLGRLLIGPTYGAPPAADSWPSARGQRARGSQPGQPAAGLAPPRRTQMNAALLDPSPEATPRSGGSRSRAGSRPRTTRTPRRPGTGRSPAAAR